MPLNSASNNPLDSWIRSTFAGQLKIQCFFYRLAPPLENKLLKHKRAAPYHMYLDSPFHSNQAAAKERTYRETDGPALNTRRNSLEGLRVREGDGMSKLQINATVEFSIVFTAEPAVNTVTHTTATNTFSLTQKGKILQSFFASCFNGKAASESVMRTMMTVSKATSSHPQ